MKSSIPLADLAEDGKLNFIDTDKIDEFPYVSDQP